MGGLHLPPDEGMFRRAAIEERAASADPTPVLEVSPPWTWAVTLAVVSVLVLGTWALLRIPVEVTGRARGALWPEAGAPVVVAFLPERDHPLLKAGDGVVVEGEPLAPGEPAALAGRVIRIGGAPAPAREIHDLLGEWAPVGPVYRVDVEIVPAPAAASLRGGPANGRPVVVRFRLRRQTLAALLFEPARRLLR